MLSKPTRKPTMYMIAGPNGAGKSTLYTTVIAPKVAAPFINADIIQRDELKDPSMVASYKAAEIAEERRKAHLADRVSFVSESTFSHPSKLALIDDAKLAGFRVVLYHVSVRNPNLSVARVAARFDGGGHNVPEEKIRERYERNKELIRQAALRSDRAFVYDNSIVGKMPALAVEFKTGDVVWASEKMPAWAREVYSRELEMLSPARLNPAAASFEDAKQIAVKLGGAEARLSIPRTSGQAAYRGKIVGETSLHWIQQLADHSYVAHFKSKLEGRINLQDDLLVKYLDGQCLVRRPGALAPVQNATKQSPSERTLGKKVPKL
jgi:predicted ABC-type ATPase